MTQDFINRTVVALISRGLSSSLDVKLKNDGWTIATLTQKSDKELKRLRLKSRDIIAVRGKDRPKIPSSTGSSVIFKNKFQCCVCRDPSKEVILHHIIPWSKSKDHAESNIAVLCLEHHERAHITGGLSRGLSSAQIKKVKAKWEDACAKFDMRSILDVSLLRHDAWLYFNHLRLFEIAREVGVEFAKLDNYEMALSAELIRADGALCERSADFAYMYDDFKGEGIYRYVKEVLEVAISRLNIINISDSLDKTLINSIIVVGDFLFVQGAHTFRSQRKRERGRGDIVQGTRRVNNITINFVFDRWEATSCSAWSGWLSGTQASGSLLHVKNIERSNSGILISGTVLAISNGHSNLKKRDYAPNFGQSVYFGADSDEQDDFGICSDGNIMC